MGVGVRWGSCAHVHALLALRLIPACIPPPPITHAHVHAHLSPADHAVQGQSGKVTMTTTTKISRGWMKMGPPPPPPLPPRRATRRPGSMRTRAACKAWGVCSWAPPRLPTGMATPRGRPRGRSTSWQWGRGRKRKRMSLRYLIQEMRCSCMRGAGAIEGCKGWCGREVGMRTASLTLP
jgi:hypothetical protein